MNVFRKIQSAHTLAKRRYLYWRWTRRKAEPGLAPHGLPARLVVSLTSYPPRFPTLAPVLKSLLSQSVGADKTVLWVARDDFGKLPREVKDLQTSGLSIYACEDIRSYKKLIPALDLFAGHFIVTADDDIIYEKNWLKDLTSAYAGDNKEVICARAHTVTLDSNGRPNPYRLWKWETASEQASQLTFPTSGAGALYPPKIFDDRVMDKASFMTLSPHADDLWLYWMALLNGASFRRVGPQNKPLMVVKQSQSVTLARINNGQSDGNAVQMERLLNAYGFPKINGAA